MDLENCLIIVGHILKIIEVYVMKTGFDGLEKNLGELKNDSKKSN